MRRWTIRRALALRGKLRDDRGSLPLVMLVIMIGVGFSAVLLPMLLRQQVNTRTDVYRNQQLGAAEAGIDVVLGQIRGSVDPAGDGTTSNLPCTWDNTTNDPAGNPITGTVNGADQKYRVTITYYPAVAAPTGQTATPSNSWTGAELVSALNNPTDPTNAANLAVYDPTAHLNGHGMRCSSGDDSYTRTYLPAGGCSGCAGPAWNPTVIETPSYAVITSTGSDGHGSRTVRATYQVQTTNANVSGGTIEIYPADSNHLYCMDAGSASPFAGQPVTLQKCDASSQAQRWAYNADLSIELTSSVNSTYSNGLCLTPVDTHTANPPQSAESSGQSIRLLPCTAVPGSPWYQQWSVDGDAYLEGANAGAVSSGPGTGLNGLCIHIDSQAVGSPLYLKTCPSGGSVTDTNNTWVESPDVGSGMAGAANKQVVNFQQFGRCLDVTNENVNGSWSPPASTSADGGAGGNNYLIAYTCKQNPDVTKIEWNQKWIYDATTGHYITNNGTNYCLRSPVTAALSSSTNYENEPTATKLFTGEPSYSGKYYGPYVTVVACSSCPDTRSGTYNWHTDPCHWDTYGGTDSSGNPRPANEKYTVKDAAGNCLDLGTNSADWHVAEYSKVIVNYCTGTKAEEWNGLPDVKTPIVQGYTELFDAG